MRMPRKISRRNRHSFRLMETVFKVNKSVCKPYIPILLTVCNNIDMKNVIKFAKSVKSLDVNLLNQLNVL